MSVCIQYHHFHDYLPSVTAAASICATRVCLNLLPVFPLQLQNIHPFRLVSVILKGNAEFVRPRFMADHHPLHIFKIGYWICWYKSKLWTRMWERMLLAEAAIFMEAEAVSMNLMKAEAEAVKKILEAEAI